MEGNIYKRMAMVTNDLRTVGKNLNVSTGKSSYKAVSELDILNAVKPIENKYGIYSYPSKRNIVETMVLEKQNSKQLFMRIETVYRFVNIDDKDDYIEIVSYGDGIDSGDKACGKAMTYCDKYALMKAYKISTGDDPDQEASQEYDNYKRTERMATDDQLDWIDLNSTNEQQEWCLKKLNRESIDMLTYKEAEWFIRAIKGKQKEVANG